MTRPTEHPNFFREVAVYFDRQITADTPTRDTERFIAYSERLTAHADALEAASAEEDGVMYDGVTVRDFNTAMRAKRAASAEPSLDRLAQAFQDGALWFKSTVGVEGTTLTPQSAGRIYANDAREYLKGTSAEPSYAARLDAATEAHVWWRLNGNASDRACAAHVLKAAGVEGE